MNTTKQNASGRFGSMLYRARVSYIGTRTAQTRAPDHPMWAFHELPQMRDAVVMRCMRNAVAAAWDVAVDQVAIEPLESGDDLEDAGMSITPIHRWFEDETGLVDAYICPADVLPLFGDPHTTALFRQTHAQLMREHVANSVSYRAAVTVETSEGVKALMVFVPTAIASPAEKGCDADYVAYVLPALLQYDYGLIPIDGTSVQVRAVQELAEVRRQAPRQDGNGIAYAWASTDTPPGLALWPSDHCIYGLLPSDVARYMQTVRAQLDAEAQSPRVLTAEQISAARERRLAAQLDRQRAALGGGTPA